MIAPAPRALRPSRKVLLAAGLSTAAVLAGATFMSTGTANAQFNSAQLDGGCTAYTGYNTQGGNLYASWENLSTAGTGTARPTEIVIRIYCPPGATFTNTPRMQANADLQRQIAAGKGFSFAFGCSRNEDKTNWSWADFTPKNPELSYTVGPNGEMYCPYAYTVDGPDAPPSTSTPTSSTSPASSTTPSTSTPPSSAPASSSSASPSSSSPAPSTSTSPTFQIGAGQAPNLPQAPNPPFAGGGAPNGKPWDYAVDTLGPPQGSRPVTPPAPR